MTRGWLNCFQLLIVSYCLGQVHGNEDWSSSEVINFVGLTAGVSSVDGSGTIAQFTFPSGIAMSSSDEFLYVADTTNNRIRRVQGLTLDECTSATSAFKQEKTRVY